MKWISFLMMTFGVLAGFSQDLPEKRDTKWIVAQNSRLLVNGSTNINKFSCSIMSYPKTDTLLFSKGERSQVFLLSGQVNLEIADFNCLNRLMTRELKQTLKSEDFPLLKISFLSLKCVFGREQCTAEGWMAIELTGVKKRYLINYTLTKENGTLSLSGTKEIRFSDFNLSPPKKMGNLVKAKDELTVIFELRLTKS